MYRVDIERNGIADDELYDGRRIFGDECSLKWEIAVHPCKSAVIVINCPGFGGSKDGYNGKCELIAELIVKKGIGAVVRTDNREWGGFVYEQSIQDDLQRVIEYALENSMEICGSENPAIYLMGFSAGASAVAALAHRVPPVKKILLIAPTLDVGEDAVKEGLKKYRGELSITLGEKDQVVSVSSARRLYNLAKKASPKRMATVPDCDHQFRGKTNGMIFSKTPLWAFAGENTYPSPKGGIVLYT